MRFVRLAAMILVMCCVVDVTRADESVIRLDDGKSLKGWEGDSKYWRIEDASITGEIVDGQTLADNQFIFWKNQVHDFELTLEFRIRGTQNANSGIQFRAQRLSGGLAAGYQADLDDGATWLGRIYDEHGRGLIAERGTRVSIAPDGRRWVDAFADPAQYQDLLLQDPLRRDQWNTYSIKAAGSHVEVRVNDRLCSVLDDHQMGEAEYSGRLALQLHSGPGPVKVQFRNIYLKQLGKTEFPKTAPIEANADVRQTQSAALWHLRPNPASSTSVDNQEAQAVVAGMLLTPGFQAELIAAEPDVHQPVAFTIDERGRLWVVEAFSYPNRQPEGEGKDRIRILEDADGDGVFETKKTFCDGLNLVSGIEVGFGGVWLGAAPHLLFIADSDHDDHPDSAPEILLDGFGYQDTHETLNSFVWGPDGWLYGNQGVFNTALIGKPGAPDAERLELRSGVWRYHPLKHKFEVFAHGGSNQWGLAFNDVGHLFMTHCRSYWGGGGTTYVIHNGHFWNQTNANYPQFVSNFAPREMPHLQNFLPASAKYDSGEGGAGKPGTDLVYGGHSHVGTMVYLGDNFPAIYRDHLFTHNLHGHQVNHQWNVREGSAYETLHAGYDLMYTPDPAFVAVDLDYGPCGGVYMIDWVDRQHCHNPRGEIWDRTNGRIYRVTWAASYKPVQVDLSKMTDLELVNLQEHPNRWYGRTARRILAGRAAERKLDSQAVAQLGDQIENNASEFETLCALWSLHVTGELQTAQVEVALKHESDVVRAWALRLATETVNEPQVATTILHKIATNDPSPSVRLALASALPQLESSDRWNIGAALADHGDDARDRFLPKMIWYGIAPLVSDDVQRSFDLARSTKIESLSDSIYWYAARLPEGRDALVGRMIASSSVADQEHLLRLMHFGLQYDNRLPMPAQWPKAVQRFSEASSSTMHRISEELSAVFGDEDVLDRMRAALGENDGPIEERRRALSLLKRVGDTKANSVYIRLLDDDELRADVIPLIPQTGDVDAAKKLLELFPALDPAQRTAALGVLTSRPEFALVLLQAVEGQSFDRKHLTALQIRQMNNLGDEQVNALLEKVWGKVGTSSADAEQLIAKLRQTYTTAPLWAFSQERGAETYKKTCAVCHPLDGSSVSLGPGLAGSWRNGLDYFLENITDPNAVVGENYRTTVITTTSGTVVSGLLDSETPTSIVLRTAEKTITIPKSEVDERKLVSQSIMPTGLLNDLSEIEVIELLKFLTSAQ